MNIRTRNMILALMLMVLSISIFAYIVKAQQETMPFIDPSMIEISYDGTTWRDATTLVSGIQIIEGQVTATHVTHARRGTIIKWEGQLGTPHETQKGIWMLDTGLIPASENKFYIRWKFGVINSDSTTDESPVSDPSDVVKLIGRPAKAVNTGEALISQ